MTDPMPLVRELRERDADMFLRPSIFAEAADEIERLRAEVARLERWKADSGKVIGDLAHWWARSEPHAPETLGTTLAHSMAHTISSLRAELASFRKVTITAVEESFDGETGEKDGEAIEVDGDEWIGVPCEVWIRNEQKETSNG